MMARAAAALVLEGLLGYPDWLYRRVGHPVGWIGAVINDVERALNRADLSESRRRMNGAATAALVAGCGAGLGLILQGLADRSGRPNLLAALFATPGLAQRSLHDHVEEVRRPLLAGPLAEAREAVGRIVGRDTAALSASGVAAAALESLAESFNDGVVAPAFWLAVAGLPGLYAYKAINTADSLIGHKEPRWRAFGWAAARADDMANLVPARIAGALIALAGGGGWRIMFRDARKHASPNAGWPEAAMAGTLRVRLGGPAVYDGLQVERPVFGAGGSAPGAEDLARGLAVYRRACVILLLGIAAWGLIGRRRR
jgi:adenosylcobinamide-phosphate synthase